MHKYVLVSAGPNSPESMKFTGCGQVILDWLGKLETWCVAQPPRGMYQDLCAEFAWLRAAFQHQLPGTDAPGKQVEDMWRTMRGLPRSRPGGYAPGSNVNVLLRTSRKCTQVR